MQEDDPLSALNAFLEEVSLVADTESGESEGAKVSLMTLHSAKGLEFPVVFMAGMEDGLFPSYMAISIVDEDKSEIEEERRLCYVGITRAKKKLFMTFARERLVRGERHTSRISRFVSEIEPSLIKRVNNSYVGDDFGFENAVTSGASGGAAEPAPAVKEEKTRWRGGFVPKNKAKFDFMSMGSAKRTSPAGAGFKKTGEAPASPDTAGSGGYVSTSGTGFGKDFLKEFNPGAGASKAADADSSYTKPSTSKFSVGDRVSNERFGDGTVTNVEDKGRDNLLTVEFDEMGVKKMFEGFINLRKI